MPDEAAAKRRTAFAALAQQHDGDLLRAACRLCRGDLDRAQDIVQDTWVRAYEAYAAGHFREGTNARAWLLRIVTNLFINDYNRRRKWESGPDLETLTSGGEAGPVETHAPSQEIPGVALMERTLDEELERALGKLSDGLRLCVVLVDVEGLDYAEAAAALQVPIGTVRSRLSRARMQLTDILSDWARRHGHQGNI